MSSKKTSVSRRPSPQNTGNGNNPRYVVRQWTVFCNNCGKNPLRREGDRFPICLCEDKKNYLSMEAQEQREFTPPPEFSIFMEGEDPLPKNPKHPSFYD